MEIVFPVLLKPIVFLSLTFWKFGHLRCLCTFAASYKGTAKNQMREFKKSPWKCSVNWVGLEGSSVPDGRSIVLECSSNIYDALCNRVGAAGAMSDKRTEAVTGKKQWWKTNHLCPRLNTESYILRLLFYQIAFVRWGGFLNNAIG